MSYLSARYSYFLYSNIYLLSPHCFNYIITLAADSARLFFLYNKGAALTANKNTTRPAGWCAVTRQSARGDAAAGGNSGIVDDGHTSSY
jgi:hypothetical protein